MRERAAGDAAPRPWPPRGARAARAAPPGYRQGMAEKLLLSDDEWRRRLTPEQYDVLRGHGTEQAWTGCFTGSRDPGTYVCAGCGNPLFRSGEKYESGTGWPSFTRPVSPDAVTATDDRSHGMRRTEVRCARCDGHLGHVFPDGPPPTGLRYCMNSAALRHVPDARAAAAGPDAVPAGR